MTSSCSFDLVKTLWPRATLAFVDVLDYAGLKEEVFAEEGEGLTLAEYADALALSLPSSLAVETWSADSFATSAELESFLREAFARGGEVLVNYQEDDGPGEGHWAAVTELHDGAVSLLSPGYSAEKRVEILTVSRLLALTRTTDPLTGVYRGFLVITTLSFSKRRKK